MRIPPFFLVSLLIFSQHYMEEWCTNTIAIFLSFWTRTQCAPVHYTVYPTIFQSLYK